ncbi:MAG: fumarylacetoacetate hydrolase family protein [Gemmatimonadaceae bacterium]|nr:fumarylacetoacetate hydrolase family protein [Gemmatimonadaceae bacterium]
MARRATSPIVSRTRLLRERAHSPATQPISTVTHHSSERPGKIVCVGRNYREHAKELGNEVPKEPLIFLKPPSSVIRSGDAIVMPGASSQVEFEGEIGIVIGKRLTGASEDEGRAAIRGIVAVNDVTARDLQKTDSQWTRAKGFDTFCPLGEESSTFPALDDLTVVTRVNGTERQRGRSSEMVFSIPALLANISRIMTLEPGDLVATGTPSGVGPLAEGDSVEVEIPGVSRVTNTVTRSR